MFPGMVTQDCMTLGSINLMYSLSINQCSSSELKLKLNKMSEHVLQIKPVDL